MANVFEVLAWQNSFQEGLHGIVKDPDGREGFVSVIGGGFSFMPIGEGQDAGEVAQAAAELHRALTSPMIDASILRALGGYVEQLGKPKGEPNA